MERTLGTIATARGIARLIHDDKAKTLVAHYYDGSQEAFEEWMPTASWRNARKQLIAIYGNTLAYHDSWVLCLRPTTALQISRSEAK